METSISKRKLYERIFSLGSLFLFLFDLNNHSFAIKNDDQICWPHWENCRSLPFLEQLPNSYNNTIMFAFVFLLIVVGLVGVFKKQEKIYIPALWILASFKFFYHFFWHFSGQHNFELFHLIPTFAFLINVQNRIFAAQVSWAICYFVAAFVKIHPSWIVGSYFSSLSLGLPFFPHAIIPIVSQGVILFEIFCSWALLTKKYRLVSLVLWTLFHVYSVILVGFYYPTRSIIILFALFLDEIPINKNIKQLNSFVMAFFVAIFSFQLLPLLYNEDSKVTLRFEGYGYNMFDANYQCVNNVIQYKDGIKTDFSQQQSRSRYRCSPHLLLEKIRILCEKNKPEKISWQLIQSINGEPFHELINEENACQLKYSLFGENTWIKKNDYDVIGYPQYNAVNGDLIKKNNPDRSIIFADPIIQLTPLQAFIKAHYDYFFIGYFIMWTGMLVFVGINFLKRKV